MQIPAILDEPDDRNTGYDFCLSKVRFICRELSEAGVGYGCPARRYSDLCPAKGSFYVMLQSDNIAL